jgi:hypothetical protein
MDERGNAIPKTEDDYEKHCAPWRTSQSALCKPHLHSEDSTAGIDAHSYFHSAILLNFLSVEPEALHEPASRANN